MDQPVSTPQATQPSRGFKSKLTTCTTKIKAVHREYNFLLVGALVSVILMYLLYVTRTVHPFGQYSVLVLDLNAQYVSFYEYLRSIFFGEGSILYSFCRALGGEFMGMYDYYVASPFAWLVALFPAKYMQEALMFIFLLKTALCSMSMGFYLYKHSVTKNKMVIIIFSIMYALCSYGIIQQHNSMWIDAVMLLPILAYAIEGMIKRGSFRLYVLTLAIVLISNFYIGYMMCIFVVAYCFYYYFAHNQDFENNPTGEKSHFIRSVGRMVLWSVLAVGIAAIIIITARYSLALGKDDFSNPSWEITQKFDLFELLIKFFPSSYDTVRPEGLPFVYCGVLTLMMVPAFFFSKKISNREKIAAALFILFFIASFATSTIDLIWHGFQKPNWLNYRYSYMLCFFLLVLAFRGFEHLEFVSRKSMLGVTVAIGLVVLLLQELGDYITEGNEKLVIRPWAMVWLTLGCLVAYFIIICLWGKARGRFKDNLAVVLAFLVCVEVFLSGTADMKAFHGDVVYGKYNEYMQFTQTFRPIVDTIYENDDDLFRMEKTYYRKPNDNFAIDINGLTNSTSTLNRETLDFLAEMGYAAYSHQSKYATFGGKDKTYFGTPVNDALLGLKYLITDKDLDHIYGEPVYTYEDYGYAEGANILSTKYKVYRNDYALSFGVGVSDAWADFDSSQFDNPFERINAMVTAMLGASETVQIFVPVEQVGDPQLKGVTKSTKTEKLKDADGNTANDTVGLFKYTCSSDSNSIVYTYKVPANTELYFYTASNNGNRKEVDLKSSTTSKTLTYGATGENQRIIQLGQSASEEMTLEVVLKKKEYIVRQDWTAVYYIDWDAFTSAMTTLQKGQIDFSETKQDHHLIGSVSTTQDEQLIYTSVPYDEGWKITVDGKSVETKKAAGALVSFTIDGAGEHEVEMLYMPTPYVLGFAISGICLVIFLLLVIFYRYLNRIPFVKHFVKIQRPDLPELVLPDEGMLPTTEDLGHVEEPTPPVCPAIVVPEASDVPEVVDEDQTSTPKKAQPPQNHPKKKK